jgi:hypothetical protein
MKTALSTFAMILLGSGLLAACDTPEKAQRSADQARLEVDEKASQAQRVADQAKMQAEGSAQQKQDEARIALTSAKDACRLTLTTLLSDVDKRVSDLQAADNTASPSERTKNGDRVANLAVKRNLLNADVKQLDAATASGWEAFKAQVDKDTSETRTLLLPMLGAL